ncbi:MAG: imidazolonepropionase [Bacteroidales bacterium]|nr:imidazolonepropionase [Bacteroidales bacterium]
MNFLIINIKQLIQAESKPKQYIAGKQMSKLPIIKDAFLYVESGRIRDFGKMDELASGRERYFTMSDKIIDATDKIILPTYCDSHTHIVYAGSREKEFVDKIKGLTYEEIAKRGGGILNSAALLQQTSENELFEQTSLRIKEIMALGTGAVEIKSGYGLTPEAEIKMLRVIQRLKETFPIKIKATFLGAHAIPPKYKEEPDEYVDVIINEMIPVIAGEDLADFIDVFCDKGFFTPEQTERILMAGLKYGLRAKIHANELDHSGGIEVGVKYNALSVDHIEYTSDEDIQLLLQSDTMPTVLPGAAFFLNMPLAPARKMIDAGLPIAFASDYNPGSSPSGNMNLVLSMACIRYKLLPEEAINACTINTAYAMGVSDTHGSIALGKAANFIITKPIPSYEYIPYSFGNHVIESVYINGELQKFYE